MLKLPHNNSKNPKNIWVIFNHYKYLVLKLNLNSNLPFLKLNINLCPKNLQNIHKLSKPRLEVLLKGKNYTTTFFVLGKLVQNFSLH